MLGIFRPNQSAEHKFGRANLSLYLDERLGARDKQRLERHLTACQACQADLATLRRTVALLRQAPMRRVPRSFALPASAQRQQAAYRRWGSANVALRVSALTVSLLLVLFVSSDIWLGFQALPMASVPVPVTAKLAQPAQSVSQGRAIVSAPQQSAPAATAARLAAAQPAATEPGIAQMTPPGEPITAPAQPPLGLRDEGDAAGRGAGGGVVERAITAPARTATGAAAPAPTLAASRVAELAGTATRPTDGVANAVTGKPAATSVARGGQTVAVGVKATDLPATGDALSVTLAVSGTLPTNVAAASLTSTLTLAKAGGGTAPTVQPVTPTVPSTVTLLPTPTQAAPTRVITQPTSQPAVRPTQGQVAKSLPEATQTASQARVAADQSASAPPNAWVWPLWRAARTLAGLSAGLLLVLLAGILWSGQKRRV